MNAGILAAAGLVARHNSPIRAGEVIELDHPQIEGLLFVTAPAKPADSHVELRVGLRDGRNFSFTVYTPSALSRLMDTARQTSIVDPDMMIVREVTLEAVIQALDKMLAAGIERFGLPV